MNAENNETVNKLKESSKDSMKSAAKENKFNKFKNNQPQIENPEYTENKIKIDEMKDNMIRVLAEINSTHIKDKVHLQID